MKCKLDKEDCAEIYHALGSAYATNLQARIGYDGEGLAGNKMRLEKSDALTIHRAMTSKREQILRGAYDSFPGEVTQVGSTTFKLAEQFGRILAEIGFLGENLISAQAR